MVNFGIIINQDYSMGIFFEKDIPEIPGITIYDNKEEVALNKLRNWLPVLLRDVDNIKKFHDQCIMGLLRERKDFKPHDFKLSLFGDGRLWCFYSESNTLNSGISQNVRIKYNTETGAIEVDTDRIIEYYVKNYKIGYDILYKARTINLDAIYFDKSWEIKRRHCMITKSSTKNFTSFPGWKKILDVSKDSKILKSIS